MSKLGHLISSASLFGVIICLTIYLQWILIKATVLVLDFDTRNVLPSMIALTPFWFAGFAGAMAHSGGLYAPAQVSLCYIAALTGIWMTALAVSRMELVFGA